jgi:phosphotriesterase-related protein
MLGGAAGLGMVAGCGGDQAAPELAQAAPTLTGVPPDAVIRTLRGDRSPGAIQGTTLFHEHLSIRMSPDAPSATDDVDNIIEEVRIAATEGVGCIVDGGHPELGRDIEALRRIALETDVHIVACTGHYMGRVYPDFVETRSEDRIATGLVSDAEVLRLGAYGEIGQNSNAAEMTALEQKVFRAVGKAHLANGLPIFTHNAYGTGENVRPDAGLTQLDLLESVGVSPENIAIGHACCLDDPSASVLIEIAERGAFVGFDRVTGGRVPDPQKVVTIMAFLEAGHADKLLISSDYTGRRSERRPGYGNSLTVFAPLLREAGIEEDVLGAIQRDNPRRFLAFVPV